MVLIGRLPHLPHASGEMLRRGICSMFVDIRDDVQLLFKAEKLSLHIQQATGIQFGELLEHSQSLVEILSHESGKSGVAILDPIEWHPGHRKGSDEVDRSVPEGLGWLTPPS